MVMDGLVTRDARATALIGAMIGVPARANMLAALVGGQCLFKTGAQAIKLRCCSWPCNAHKD